MLSPLLAARKPMILPQRAMPMGTAKLRMAIERSSCSVPTAPAARVPRRSQKRISAGINRGSSDSYPEMKNRTPTHICVNNVTLNITASFAKNTSRTGTGIVIRIFQLLFRCSRRQI